VRQTITTDFSIMTRATITGLTVTSLRASDLLIRVDGRPTLDIWLQDI